LQVPFNPLDVPRNQFIVAGQAWQMCRTGAAAPEQFGIFDMHGWWFIFGNVIRDFLAYNKIEILPWDWWESPVWNHRLEDPLEPEERLGPYDRLAALTLAGDACLAEMHALYASEPGFHPPAEWTR
jgi:hypothetical protein